MAITGLIRELENASAGQRSFDAAIGLLLGWTRKVEHLKTDGGGEAARKVLWIAPLSDEPGNVPHFSTSIEAALLFARTISPNHVGGVSWDEDGRGTAIIEGGPYCVAASPALALCIAALKAKILKEGEES